MASFKKSLESMSAKNVAMPATLELTESDIAVLSSTPDEGFTKVQDGRYLWIDSYTDLDYSTVDELKNVVVSKKQINITQEENSQVIPFEIPRYYDGIDLSTMQFQIHYVNANEQEGLSTPINVMYSDDKLKFYWLVDGSATAVAGFLKFEIVATGTVTYRDTRGEYASKNYVWKTKPNVDGLVVLESLKGTNGSIEPSQGWDTYLTQVSDLVTQASNYASTAKTYAQNAQDAVNDIDDKITNVSDEVTAKVEANIAEELGKYYTKTEVDEKLKDIDITQQLQGVEEKINAISSLDKLNVTYDSTTDALSFYNGEILLFEPIVLDMTPKAEWVSSFTATVDEKINTNKTEILNTVDEKIKDIDFTEELKTLKESISQDYYNKEETDTKFTTMTTKVEAVENTSNTNKTNISLLNAKIAEFEEKINSVNSDPALRYKTQYDVSTGKFDLIEVATDETGEETETIVSTHIIVGGSGGSSSSTTAKIERITPSPLTVTKEDKAVIEYSFSSIDSNGDTTGEGTATWKVGNKVVATSIAVQGNNSFDLSDYVSVGQQKVTLSITDEAGTVVVKSWTVQVVDVRIESTFNDQFTYPLGTVSFDYTPYGAIEKTVHFKLDGVEIGTVKTAVSGIPMSYTLPSQTHGAHLLEAYITAEINNTTIETNHIYKDIIWYDNSSSTPVIGCVTKNITIKQYDSINIVYSVYDPKTNSPTVTLDVDGETISSLTLNKATQTWQFKSSEIGTHTLTITCRDTVKTITVEVEKLDIDVTPVTANLMFDFNPTGYSNNSADRLWTDRDVTMSVSDNFDWVNGGYQYDENGDQYFCVKSGTTATVNYNLFADDPKRNGKEFKVVFKTTNVRKRDTSFITCMNNDIGLDMKIESANIYSSNDSLYSPYCENDIIEFEFNINKNTDIPLVLTYEDGVGNRPMIYTSDASFMQSVPQPIVIGSEDCDVHIYRMKAYNSSLSDLNVKNNFIADARNAEEMIARYNRNQIYDENSALTPEVLAEKCPDLRIIVVDAPWFTNDKSDKVSDTTVQMIYKNGDPVLDNWTCTGAKHSGQGTSSNEYGYSGRNLDLIMNGDEANFTLGDGSTTSKTITLTRDSVPTNYLNIKVNIASSENANNAQFARRYNEYNPFKRTAKLKDDKVKDTMEFFNCVVFVRENNEDLSTHREFNDTNVHFYAIGNVGDSKKTDNSRVNDKNDPKEHVIEIMDYNVALAEFPTGKTDSEGNQIICPVSEWKTGNAAYDYLYAPYKYKEGEFKSFGSESYEFRYEKKGITDEERQANIDAWREAYKFVVTSDDETFKKDFEKYFVKDSILYFYLFTERYLLVDNRAKNCFVHYGKVWYTKEEATTFKETYGVEIESKYIDDTQGTFNGGYRYDLSFFYDSDTAIGIDNTGKLVLTYGQEDTDYYVDGDPSSGYIYRAAESTFFCRVRDLFPSELQAMFVDRESANAWSATSLINQWDKAQSQFPEELWRLDIQRKYLRTYLGISVDNSIVPSTGAVAERFLKTMLNGRKKYQRRMFERNQELYMATKYFGNTATQDQIMMRFNNPDGVETDFTLRLTPYSDMYIGVKFGNFTATNFRAKAGREYVVPYTLDTADITLIYGASFIQEIGDLSKCYVGDNDFSKASRLQRLSIGSDREGYSNGFMTTIGLGSNTLLEYLDIRNVTGLNSVVDLSQCNNFLELHAEGSGATGVIFSNGGKLQKAYLPPISSLTAKNLNNIEVFDVESYDNLLSLIVENTPFIDTYKVVNEAPKLNIARLVGINWTSENTDILDRLLTIRGVDNDGYESQVSVLSGQYFATVVRQKLLEAYQNAWSDLEITYSSLITQFAVTFQNDNGDVLDVQYVDKGAIPVDPITRKDDPIATPTKESSVSTDFTFSKWDSDFVAVFGNLTITALYTETPRKYTIKYVSMGETLHEEVATYNSVVLYDEIPVYTSEESSYKYCLFDRWDKSGLVTGDKTINAIFDTCQYTKDYFKGKELSELRPVELYALTMLEQNKSIGVSADSLFTEGDSIQLKLGHDYDFDDIESEEIISEKTEFNGTNHIDTNIQLFDEDRDFVLAIDFEFASGNTSGNVLAECFQANGSNGFKLWYNNTYRCTWSTTSEDVATVNNREMLVIRHIKGDNALRIYTSNMSGDAISYKELGRTKTTLGTSTLVLGASKPEEDTYENHAVGNIYWCKLWYTDLGDSACRTLASWTHEEVNMELCSFKKYYLSDNPSRRCSFTLLASHLLDGAARSLHSSDSNAGGWANAILNKEFLNKRLYSALPAQWKSIVKKVQVASSVGQTSNEISTSDCYIFIPSAIEVSADYSSDPYNSEGTTISYMTTNAARQRSRLGEEASGYWLRSPNTYNSSYYFAVTKSGSVEGFNSPLYQKLGICPMMSI